MMTLKKASTNFAPRPCPICNQPIDLKAAKTDERGKAIHEDCYVMKINFEQAAGTPGSIDFRPEKPKP